MQNSLEMKPCPFCGHTDPFVERMELYSYAVRCNGCLATGELSDEDINKEEKEHEAEAVANWNKRVQLNEDHPQFENFIRAFWRRIEPYKNDFAKELPEELPVQFRANMATALLQLQKEK